MDKWIIKSDTKNAKNDSHPTESSTHRGTRNSTCSFLEAVPLRITKKVMVRKYDL
jgi:hypothetical protein